MRSVLLLFVAQSAQERDAPLIERQPARTVAATLQNGCHPSGSSDAIVLGFYAALCFCIFFILPPRCGCFATRLAGGQPCSSTLGAVACADAQLFETDRPSTSSISFRGIFHPLLYILVSATRQELARQVNCLKTENQILRSKLPKRVLVTPTEGRQLVKAGRGIGQGDPGSGGNRPAGHAASLVERRRHAEVEEEARMVKIFRRTVSSCSFVGYSVARIRWWAA